MLSGTKETETLPPSTSQFLGGRIFSSPSARCIIHQSTMQAGSFRAKRGDDPAGKQKEIAANDSQLQRAAHADCGQQDDGIARFFF